MLLQTIQSNKMKLTTEELIIFLFQRRYEYYDVSLLLNFGVLATHIISFRKSFVWDEGICGNTVKWTKKEFLEQYSKATWIVN